eukprot:TRINITY_DN8660_c0_g1_i3.p1 TRINITY_DN8660_c0_g1~~TRINITY_DN8660_c0_g1_i3.p1  ORF type:complete len:304 (+),score=35.38 TRINITY_DN8660_c0_g1_i3:983-1894(+)
MCGPTFCLLCEPDFVDKLKKDRVTQLWAVLWLPLLIFAVIYFSFSIAKLAESKEDESFQVQLHRKNPIELPSWTICALEGTTLSGAQCTITGYNNGQILPYFNANNESKCFNFNTDLLVKRPTADYSTNTGKISCYIELSKVDGLAKVWIHDPDLVEFTPEGLDYKLSTIPSGLCTSLIKNDTHTTIHWKKNIFHMKGKDSVIGYDRMNYNVDNQVTFDPTKVTAFLTVWPGDYYEWNYKEVQWWSGYDFWYFLGLNGGMAFLLLLIHQMIFFPLKRVVGDKNGPMLNSYEREASVGPTYGNF